MKKILILILMSIMGFVHSQTLLNNLMACYPLDCNGAVNQASTGSQFDGTLNNAVCSTGHLLAPNSGYQFGNSTTLVLNNFPFTNQDICVSGWYYIGTNRTMNLAYKYLGCGSSDLFSLHMEMAPGSNPIIRLERTGGTCNVPVQYSVSSTPVTIGWHHIVFYINSTVLMLWVDNSLPYTLTTTATPLSYANAPVIFGGNPLGGMFAYNGWMDNIRFYSRQLTTTEITDLYTNDPICSSSGSNPPPPPPPPGNYCSGSQNGLTANYQVALNGFNYNFTTPVNTSAKVIIGRPACTGGQARLVVGDDNIGIGLHSSSSTTGNNIGIKGTGTDQNNNNSVTTFGVMGEALQPTGNLSALSAGVAGFCGLMNSSSMPPGENIGVYGNSLANNGKWAGYFDGDVQFNGMVWGSQNVWVSDKRFKNNINELGEVSAKLKTIKGYSYLYKTDEFKNRNFPKTEQIGFLAQELKEVFPQLVLEDSHGYLGVNYVGFIPVLLQAHKEQQTQIENQQQQIDELKALVQSLAGTTLGSKNKAAPTNVELSDKNSIVLNQNVPNPFAETTVINYNVPTDFGKAQIIFSTADGKVIKVVEISEKGAGSLNVFANDLTHGLYSYTLVVDGKIIDTKKMIKE